MVCNIKKSSLFLLLFFSFNSHCTEDKACLNSENLEKLNALLSQIPSEKILEYLILREKCKLLEAIFAQNKDANSNQKEIESLKDLLARESAQKNRVIHNILN